MRQLALTRAAVLTPFELIEEATVLIRQGRILSVEAGRMTDIPEGFQEISLEGLILAPGLIDQHLHGGNGAEVMTGSVAGLSEIARFYATHGVTAFLATTSSGTEEQLTAVAAAYHKLNHSDYKGARCLGIHLGGAGLASVDSELWRNDWPVLSVAGIERLQQRSNFGIKMITLAPEQPGALDLASLMVKRGISCSLGASGADYATTVKACETGFSCVAHCFNQLKPFHHQEPGVIGAALLHKGLAVEIIADGQQLHPATLELVWRLKGSEGIILVSDAMAPTGLSDGTYSTYAGELTLEQGRLTDCHGRLAGSVVTLEQTVQHFWKSTGCELTEAFQMATYNPAKQLGISDFKGSLAPGKDADLIAITPDFDVVMTMIAGEIISGLIVI